MVTHEQTVKTSQYMEYALNNTLIINTLSGI